MLVLDENTGPGVKQLGAVLTPKEWCILHSLGFICLISGSLLIFTYCDSMNLKYSKIHL